VVSSIVRCLAPIRTPNAARRTPRTTVHHSRPTGPDTRPASRAYTTFQLYKADDRWLVVNMADTKG
jgi:hypothetical protein